MADEIAGRLFIELLPDVDKKKFQAAIDASTTGTTATVTTTLKLAKTAVTDVILDANEKLAARKKRPVLFVDLALNKASVTPLIVEADAVLAARKRRPKLTVDLGLGKNAPRKAAAQAKSVSDQVELYDKKLTAKINREHLNRDKLAAIHSAKQGATYAAQHKYMTQIAESAAMKRSALLAAEAARAAEIEAVAQAKRAGALNAAVAAGLDQRSLIEQRAAVQRGLIEQRAAKQKELINLRAENAVRRSSRSTLRMFRNDLSQFDASSSRILRRTGFIFAGLTAGITASFAGIGVAALRSFAETETQIRRTAAVLGSDVYAQRIANLSQAGVTGAKAQEEAYKAFRIEVEKTDAALRATVEQAAFATVFNPTEIASGTRALAQAGLKTEEIKKSLLGVAQFAQNEELLPEDAVANLVQGATAAGESLSDLTAFADEFTFVANDTTSSAKEIADAFANRAAPAFNAYGESVASTLTVLDLFARAGIRGRTAGEQVGILIREINKASTKTPKTTAAFKKYGIEVGKVNGKQVPFLKTLGQLGVLLDQVRKEKGSQGLARVRKELGLTEKSGAGLLQILPQIAKGTGGSAAKAVKQLENLRAQIDKSIGATKRQADIITNTLGFQFEQFTNQIGTLFRVAAGPTGKALTDTFKRFNDELVKGDSAGRGLRQRFLAIGEAISKKVVPALERFFFGGEGEKFFGGIFKMYKGFLVGLQNAFIEFRTAAFGAGANQGFFSVLGSGFAALGRFAETTLPKIGRALGVIVRFFRENKDSVRLFVKSWLGLLIASKTLRLFILPLVAVGENIRNLYKWTKAFIALDFVGSIANLIPVLGRYRKQVAATAAATEALAAAQAGAASVQGLSVAKAGGVSAAAAGAATVAPVGKLKALSRVLDDVIKKIPALRGVSEFVLRGGTAISRFTRLAGVVGLVIAAVEAAFNYAKGAIKGFVDELTRTDSKSKEVTASLRSAAYAVRVAWDGIVAAANASWTAIKFVGSLIAAVFANFERQGASVGRMIAGVFRSIAVEFGSLVSAIRSGNLINILKAIGDAVVNFMLTPFKVTIGFILDSIADVIATGRGIPGVSAAIKPVIDPVINSLRGAASSARDFRVSMYDASSASTTFGNRASGVKRAADGMSASINGVKRSAKNLPPVMYDAARGLFVSRKEFVRNKDAASNWSIVFQDNLATTAQSTADHATNISNSIFDITTTLQNAGEQIRLQMASDAALVSSYQQMFQQISAGTLELTPAQMDEQANLAAAAARAQAMGVMAAPIEAAAPVRRRRRRRRRRGRGDGDGGGNGDGDTTDVIEQVQTAAEQATEAVNRLSQAQLNQQAGKLVAKVMGSAAKGYQATAQEAEILKRTLPALEAQLENQRNAVAKLDEALQNLQQTQIKGTQAFSDQAFAIEQSIKKIQLQRLDLIIAGTPEEDAAIKALDEQINQLQQRSERLSLVESLQLDPLRRKLEQTFNPVKELSFADIIKQFQQIQKQRAPLVDAIAGGETLKTTLEATIKDAEARFGDAGRQVTAGFALGIRGSTGQVAQAGQVAGNAALGGVNSVMRFGSPSRTMFQRGIWAVEGFANGIRSSRAIASSAGVSTMFGYLVGMRSVYQNRVQPFILSIAKWIKENKGPVSYDATLLRPAGEAMMKGFHRGLKDGFGEVKTWVSDVGPDLARHTIPDKIFKKMSAEFIIGNATADMAFDPGEFFASITPTAEVGVGAAFLGQSTSLIETIKQAQMIARMFGITPNIASERRRYNNPAYNASIGGADNSLHIFGRAMDYTGSDSALTKAANWARKYTEIVFEEVLWKTKGHYTHLHLGWKYGTKKLIADIGGASEAVEMALANASSLTNVDFNLLAAIAKAESGFNPNSVSPVGAGGLMQLMPGTAASLGVRNVFDPKQNALGGAKYIKAMLEAFNGNVRLALAGYNAGPGNARIAVNSFSETVAYIERVLRYFNQFKAGNYRAQGGKVNAMTPYVVGERGQELFIPSRNGSVVSNKDLRDLISALSGGQPAAMGTTINDNRKFEVISNSNDPATVAALVDARMRSQIVGVKR